MPAKNQKKSEEKKANPTDFNIERKTTFAGYKEKKLENCTKIDDVKAYRDKYKQNNEKK
jgi:hypothetical protein